VRAMTSPFVTKIEHLGRSVAAEARQVPSSIESTDA
jgi:ornithine racemase